MSTLAFSCKNLFTEFSSSSFLPDQKMRDTVRQKRKTKQETSLLFTPDLSVK